MFGWGDPVKRFWKQVERAAERERRGKFPQYMFSHKVNLALRKYDERLWVEVMGSAPPIKENIIITSRGNAAAFASIYRLRDSAPQIAGWGFVFLIPPSDLYAVDVDDYLKVIVDEIRFHPVARGSRFDLDLYIEGWEPGDSLREGAAQALVFGRVGEISYATRIGQIRYHSQSEPEAATASPLKEIRPRLGLQNSNEE